MQARRRTALPAAANWIRAAILAVLTGLAHPAALAQEVFPNRPVKIITPTAAGGNIDILARSLAEKLSAAWGQGVVVEPRDRKSVV